MSVQASIVNLLRDMKERYRLTMVFIAHDMAVVNNVSDRVAVMYLGKLCEVGSPEQVYRTPLHPYTQVLVESIPHPDPSVRAVDLPDEPAVDLPSPLAPPSGCRFRTRCPLATERCAAEEPVMRAVGVDHFVACHHADAVDVTASTPASHGPVTSTRS